MTPLSSMVLASILGLTGLPMAMAVYVLAHHLLTSHYLISKIGDKPNRFAVFIEPLTQIDLIIKYAPSYTERMQLSVWLTLVSSHSAD